MAETRDKAGCEPCKHEMFLQKLVDSINDTARTVRNTLFLVLLAGLYLILSLAFSTDENLLRDSRIALPQVGVGISLSASYIVAPVIFLYLHFHMLFLLDGLKRKIQAFKWAIKDLDAKDKYWNWLSSSAFVQSLRFCSGCSPKVLVWLSVVALPLMLLLAIFLSFVRYQSDWITVLHRIVFILDLAFVAFFRSECFAYIERICSSYRKKCPENPGTGENPEGTDQNCGQEASITDEIPSKKKIICKILKYLKYLLAWSVLISMVLSVSLVKPLDYDSKYNTKPDPNYAKNNHFLERTITAIVQAKLEKKNYFDAILCQAWDLVCRYLTIDDALPDIHGIDLHARELRFARFGSAKLDKANFRSADLRGAYLEGGKLQGADLQNAKLQGANFSGAKLQGANFGGAELQNTNLKGAELQNADLRGAKSQGTNFKNVQLQGARLVSANLIGENLGGVKLQNADLRFAVLQGVNFEGAQLEGADLQNAKLQGANFTGAQLQGARLQGAELQGANLEDARLEGADLGGVQLQGSFGQFDSWHLVWMPDVSFHFPILQNRPNGGSPSERARSYIDELLKKEGMKKELTWRENVSLGVHINEYIMEGVDRDSFRNSRPNIEDKVFYTHTGCPDWPPSVDLNDKEYRKAWVAWTVKFACKNQYTALSSLQRWRREEVPLYSRKSWISDVSELKKDVRNELILKQIYEKSALCFGLRAISSDSDEWKEFVGNSP